MDWCGISWAGLQVEIINLLYSFGCDSYKKAKWGEGEGVANKFFPVRLLTIVVREGDRE